MVAQNTVRKYAVYQIFRFFEGIWLHRKNCQIRKRPILLHTCATCPELPSYMSTMTGSEEATSFLFLGIVERIQDGSSECSAHTWTELGN